MSRAVVLLVGQINMDIFSGLGPLWEIWHSKLHEKTIQGWAGQLSKKQAILLQTTLFKVGQGSCLNNQNTII